MRVGLVSQLNGKSRRRQTAPTWMSIHERAVTAELTGFNMFFFEDGLLYRGEEGTNGLWESMSVAAALAATTQTIVSDSRSPPEAPRC